MKRLDRFILKSFIGPFIAILLIVVFILMMQFLWLYIDELVGKGLGLSVILEFLGWGSATLLPLALPLATLLSSMMTLGTLGENNELLAIKAAGVSLTRVLVPLTITSLIISIGAFYASNNLIPIAYNNIYQLRADISRTKEEIKIPTGTFYNGIEGYILRIDSRDEKTGTMHGVMVYNHTKNKGNISLTIADSAKMIMSDARKHLNFVLFNGANYEETNTKKYRDTTLQLQKIDFDKQELLIPLENYAFEKTEESKFSDQAKSMDLKGLYHGQDSIGRLKTETDSVHLASIRRDRILRYNSQLDTSFRSKNRQNFDYETYGESTDIQEEINYHRTAITRANEMISTLSSYSRETYEYTYYLRRYDIEILKKFALAIACFIFFFIGAPLGAIIRKGGLGTPAIISILFFVAYWVIDISGTKLARDGATTAAIGVFISSYILFPIGLFLTYKAINDSAIFSIEKPKRFFRWIKNKIMATLGLRKIVYMGTPEFALGPLKALREEGYNIVGIVTVADKASGRGLKVNESPVKKYAVENNIPVLQPTSLKDPEFLEALRKWKADLFVVVAFRMLPKEVWQMPKLGTFNLHAALLPQYRGAAPINWAVINGEHATGVTTFMIDEGIDTGNIIMREQCKIEDDETAGDIHDRLMEIGSRLVVQTTNLLIDAKAELRIQHSYILGSEQLKPAPKLTKELCHIDWNKSTKSVYNLIRGLSPYPAAFTHLVKDGTETMLKIYKSEKLDSQAYNELLSNHNLDKNVPFGTIISDSKNYLVITTEDGAISLKSIQLSGKKTMDIKAFLLGFREPMSYRTSSPK